MTRYLGRSDIEVSALGMGCWAIGGPFTTPDGEEAGWGTVDDDESIRALHAAYDAGVTFYDTADVYGTGHSETLVGKAIADRRSKVVIATKFGIAFEEGGRRITGQSATRDYVRSACEASLRRLGTDYIDIYQFHLNDYPIEDADPVRLACGELVQEGKLRGFGWSTDFPERARFFGECPMCTVAQFQMNVLDDAPEMVGACEELDLAAINRGPLAMGLLSGKYTKTSQLPDNDVRGARSPAWMKYFMHGRASDQFLAKLDAIREILTSDGRTLVQGALAWLWARSEKTIPIPGFKTVKQVEENAGAMALGALRRDQMDEIDRLLDRA
jgi:aryl-alcohol dehydrogenase-like predicted oxidoreductase